MRSSHHRQLRPKSAIPRLAKAVCPKRLTNRPEVKATVDAITGPGASESPATSTESCHTDVMKSTFASRNAANAAEKKSEEMLESAKERTRRSAGSITGEG